MFANVLVGVRDIAKSTGFYDAVLEPLGIARVSTGEKFVGYSDGSSSRFFICLPRNGQPASAGNGTQVTLIAKSKAAVDAFHAAAMKMGGSDEGQPGFRPPEKKTNYACYIRDLDGNKLMAACSNPE